jgi:A/G-specific adenine glycosylase
MPPAATIRERLLAWYDAHGRALPWRAARGASADPYRVWLSEVMLQQTTVPHAIPYFEAFTRRWPTVGDLAGAPDAEVMAAWAGLGYYARARNLLACARQVAGARQGVFPQSQDELRTLPGLGPYTSAAVAAIAFDRPANVVDGNVERVMARLFAVETPLPGAKAELSRLAGALVDSYRPGDWAQALMDLGATVCRPRSPLCDACPLGEDCRARLSGAPETYPRRATKTARPQRFGTAFILRSGEEVALVQRPPRGLLGGMLGLPTTPWGHEAQPLAATLAHAPAEAAWREAGTVRHVFTHFALELRILEARVEAGRPDFIWTPLAAARSRTPSLFRKALGLLA